MALRPLRYCIILKTTMKKFFHDTPKVLLCLATSEKAGRDKLQGILHYISLHTPWSIHLAEKELGERQIGDIRSWGATGIILARLPAMVNAVRRSGLPTVVLDSSDLYRDALPDASYVISDSQAVGFAAADFFLSKGFQRFAYVPDTEDWDWSLLRGQAFEKRLEEKSFACCHYEVSLGIDWVSEQGKLARWLLDLPKPCAIFTARDGRARQVIDTARSAGLTTPGDIAVLGVDNDEILCENSGPTISSVQPDFVAGGYRGAETLERLMRGIQRKPSVVKYGVRGVVDRASGRPSQVVDRRTQRGMEFIRLNVGESIRVDDVVRHMGVSKRMAELLFQRALSRSIMQEIQLARLEKVKTFLLDSSLPVGLISLQCGYQTEMHAKRVFKQATGVTMSAFRKQHRQERFQTRPARARPTSGTASRSARV